MEVLVARVLMLNGPNVGIVGWRLPEHYGTQDIHTYLEELATVAADAGVEFRSVVSNHEGDLIDAVHALGPPPADDEAIIINPGGATAYGVALRSALKASDRYVVEVHISNKYARGAEGEHHLRDVIAPVTDAQVLGLGLHGYRVALDACLRRFADAGPSTPA